MCKIKLTLIISKIVVVQRAKCYSQQTPVGVVLCMPPINYLSPHFSS